VVRGHAQVSFNRNALATDLTYVLETAPDLATWTALATYTNPSGWIGGATATEAPPSALPPDQTVRVAVDLGAPSATAQFVRLRVHR